MDTESESESELAHASDSELEDDIRGKDKKHGIYDWVARLPYNLHASITKAEKAVIRKRSKTFAVVDGILHYKDKNNGEERSGQVSWFSVVFCTCSYCRLHIKFLSAGSN